jgi:hypothetical protein
MARWLVNLKQYSKQSDIFFQNLSIIVEGDTPQDVANTVNTTLNTSLEKSAAILQNKIFPPPDATPEYIHLFFRVGCRNIITKITRVTSF